MYWIIQFKNYNFFEKNYFDYKVKQKHINYINNCLLLHKIYHLNFFK